MATVTLSQTSLPLNNKFALLEETDQLGNLPSLQSFATRPKNHSRFNSTDTFKSWSVVDSDEEGQDEDLEDDVYTWNPSTDAHGQEPSDLPPPLAVANLDDGFTGISKVLTVHNINSPAAVAMASQGSWLIKGKKIRKPAAAATVETAPHHHNDEEYNTVDTFDDDEDLDIGAEHYLSKSARAVNRRNIRNANARDRKLNEVISAGIPRVKKDYKEIREARWHSKAQKSTDAEYATSGTTRK
ncbi:hypothetical protein BGW41_005170 [Actinomortierella wolfii]|nr:hypothetical protein BGW41_005170 [Actinomortierella wolfii]